MSKVFPLVIQWKIADKVEKISEEIFNAYYEITNEKYKKIKYKGFLARKTFMATKLAEHEESMVEKFYFVTTYYLAKSSNHYLKTHQKFLY